VSIAVVEESRTFHVQGHDYVFHLPAAAPDQPSSFAFGLHKAGSVLLTKIVSQLAGHAEISAVNIPGQAFGQGMPVSLVTREMVGDLYMRHGYMFTGFRSPPPPYIPPEALAGRRKVLLIRDPRDMLVSHYFSMRFSHPIPPTGHLRDSMGEARAAISAMEIDRYVLSDQCAFILSNYRGYARHIDHDWRLFRYEDVISNKRTWVREIADHLRISIDGGSLDAIADRNDIFPRGEQPNNHIRQVWPGNHKKLLRPDTISALNDYCADVLEQYGYAT
jgi:Sulfotransferase domain